MNAVDLAERVLKIRDGVSRVSVERNGCGSGTERCQSGYEGCKNHANNQTCFGQQDDRVDSHCLNLGGVEIDLAEASESS